MENKPLLKFILAFVILEANNVDVGAVKVCYNAEAYNDFIKCFGKQKTFERGFLCEGEFSLLKEVFCNE